MNMLIVLRRIIILLRFKGSSESCILFYPDKKPACTKVIKTAYRERLVCIELYNYIEVMCTEKARPQLMHELN